MAPAVNLYREQRGACLIEAGAADLHDGSHWKPWIRLTRRAGNAFSSDTFDRLKPLFASEQAALLYAAELGRNLADEGWAAASPALAATASLAADIRAIGVLCANAVRKTVHDASTLLRRSRTQD